MELISIIIVIITIISLIAWVGQMISGLAPKLAAKLGVMEPESEVDPVFFTDARGEAIWDVMTLWTLPLACILFLLSNPLWVYFGLVGGGMYVYIWGRISLVRFMMQKKGMRIGTKKDVKAAYILAFLWGLSGIIMIIISIISIGI